MRVLRGSAGAAVCAAVMAAVAWSDHGVAAQQRDAAPGAPVAVEARGNAERGKYLVENVAMCGECHSTRDPLGNIVPGTRLHGGPMPARVPWPADWPVQVPTIAGLPGYTDIQAMRLLTLGAIRRNGIQARAPMPRFRMSAQDAADVIAFLRTQ